MPRSQHLSPTYFLPLPPARRSKRSTFRALVFGMDETPVALPLHPSVGAASPLGIRQLYTWYSPARRAPHERKIRKASPASPPRPPSPALSPSLPSLPSSPSSPAFRRLFRSFAPCRRRRLYRPRRPRTALSPPPPPSRHLSPKTWRAGHCSSSRASSDSFPSGSKKRPFCSPLAACRWAATTHPPVN